MRNLIRRGLAAFIAVAACAAIVPSAASAATWDVRAKDNGGVVYMRPGDQLSLSLRSCEGSCGYSWRATAKPSSRTLSRESSTLEGQVRTWVYEARAVGDTKLELTYTSPAGKADKKFTIRVHVANLKTRLVDETYDGKTTVAHPGDHLLVQLPSCEASCGYSWKSIANANSGVLERVSSRVVTINGESIREFRFLAVGKGRTKFRLGLKPPGWNTYEDTFALGVIVR
jgi:predicted secreted protein